MEYSTLVNFFFSVSRVSTVIDIHLKKLSKIKEEEKKAPREQVKQLKQQIDIMHYCKHAHNSCPVYFGFLNQFMANEFFSHKCLNH